MTVRLEIADRVARVTIDRPARMNAIDRAAEAELERIWTELETRADVSCVVLTGAGDRAFSVGADLKDMDLSGVDYWTAPRRDGFGGISLRRSLDLPLIARVNGYALGGGFEMVLGCDIVVAADTARFGLTEARLGLMPLDGGMVLLQRKIPWNRAMAVMFTGRHWTAAEMQGFGIVNETVPAADLDAAVQAWTDDIVRCAPLSLRAIKQTATRTAHLAPHEAQGLRLPAVIDALRSADADEGVRAFNEKRAPVWRGR